MIVTDVLSEILGFDKYAEITSEHNIRGTFCDLAIKLDGELSLLIEVKAIGLELKDSHVRQAVDYAANKGCEWVALTNGVQWRVYRVTFSKPIEHELIAEFELIKLNHRRDADLEMLWLISKEGWQKSRLSEYATQQQSLNRFVLGSVVLSDPCLAVIRRELRRVYPEAKVSADQIQQVLAQDVLKRDVIEGEKAVEARRLYLRSSSRALRETSKEQVAAPMASGDPSTES
jgi:hypothetical protein